MIHHFLPDPWKIVEEGFHPELNELAESIFSLGNGMMGQRGNFEETFSGKSLQGSYIGGVYYPDKTRVGWWKNGYPEYFAKVLNSTNWMGIELRINGETLDLARCTVNQFNRSLDMQNGMLSRTAQVTLKNGIELHITSKRFYNLLHKEHAALSFSITPNRDCDIEWLSFADGDIANKDSNYDEKFWLPVSAEAHDHRLLLTIKTKKLDWHLCTAISNHFRRKNETFSPSGTPIFREKFAGFNYRFRANANESVTLEKQAVIASSFHHAVESLSLHATKTLEKLAASSFDEHLKLNANAWNSKWEQCDVIVEGDVKAQQAVRFNIFQLNQTYCGDDPRLNIGPKGFTGEKYGGSTYWDTEAYCLPFYLASSDPAISRQLLVYRYKQLDKAIENASKLGFTQGAALYPMVTMNGEECHNEWEITFEEIHRNGAIAYAIFNYIEHTGDKPYLAEYGLEVLIGIARFWAQRVHYSTAKNQFVMHGVTGPNEYENNVNNNWYTSYIAKWCMEYTLEAASWVKMNHPGAYERIVAKTTWNEASESAKWNEISHNLYLPSDEQLGIFIQNDGFLDKELIPVAQLPASERPINQKWSWDRILRSVYIKQADVLQGIYFFERDFDLETIRRNFDFYEPFTVHESSLSPCVHAILAARLGKTEKAYEMYMRTARLDLDNYNNDTEDGLHITSMAGSYLSIVQGFGGMRMWDGVLHLHAWCPPQWNSYSFRILCHKQPLQVQVDTSGCTVLHQGNVPVSAVIYGKNVTLEPGSSSFFVQDAIKSS